MLRPSEGKPRSSASPDHPATWPGVSVILAVRNEAEHLDDCLKAIAALDYPSDLLEILIIDGMSTDGTDEIIRKWMSSDQRIRCYQNPAGKVAAGMNIGVANARYDHLLWISGHALLRPEHLKQCWLTMNATGAAAVGGVLETRGTTTAGQLNAAVLSSRFGVGGGEHRIGGEPGWVPAVTMALYQRAAIVAAGGFDESLPRSQDNDLHDRMNRLGLRAYFNPEIHPVYLCRNSLRGLLRQAWHNGFWCIMLKRMNRGGVLLRHLMPMAFVGGLGLLALAGILYRPSWSVLGVMTGIYMLGALTATGMIVIGSRAPRFWILLPIWFILLHITYGAGSWAALFARRK